MWTVLTAQTLFDQLPEAVLVVDVDGRVTAINPAASQLLEIEEPNGDLSVVDLLTQPERTRLNPLAWLRKWAETPRAPELDYVYLTCVTNAGREKQLAVRTSRVKGDDADTYYLVSLRDMTTWDERLRRERDAHRLAARFLAISMDAILSIDGQHRIIAANASAERLFGYATGKLLAKPLAMLIPERFRVAHEDHMRRFAGETTASRLMSERAAITGIVSDGSEIPIEASITRITLHNETVFSVQIRDLRDRPLRVR